MAKVLKTAEALRESREKERSAGNPGGRRADIIEVARRSFAEQGFEATTMRQIADEVGILAGSLYYHFETKELMLHEILYDAVLRLKNRSEEIMVRQGTAEARLIALVFAEVSEKALNPHVFAILEQERAQLRHENFTSIMAERKAHYRAWRKILADGIAEGQFAATPAEHLTISTIIRMLNSGADWYTHEDNQVPDAPEIHTIYELASFYVNFILHAVRAPNRAGAPIAWPAEDIVQ